MEELTGVRRPLTAGERRVVQRRMRDVEGRGRRASRAAIPVTGGAVLLLWLWTLLASDSPWYVVTAFWVVVGGLLAWWVNRSLVGEAGEFRRMAEGLESALRRNTAEVYDVRATSCVALEEVEDEGACYAFAVDGGRIAFVTGQEFYPSARFPCLDFSLVYVLDERDRPVDMVLDARGDRVSPERTIPVAARRGLVHPEHLHVLAGSLDRLESLLAQEAGS